jgi:mitofusin
MTVGSGPAPSQAAALSAMLDNDSGYGGSVAEGPGGSSRGMWHPGITEDRPTPSQTPTLPGESSIAADSERRILASHVHQLY